MDFSDFFLWLLATFIVVALVWFFLHRRSESRFRARREVIENLTLPSGVISDFRRQYPALQTGELEAVFRCLRQYFRAYLESGFRPVAMPSKVVDDLWHCLILDTRFYEAFCQDAFGRMFHHIPAAKAQGDNRASNDGLRRVWYYACGFEDIDPYDPERLPELFAIDADLGIENGPRYALRPDAPDDGEEAPVGGLPNGNLQTTAFTGVLVVSFIYDDAMGGGFADVEGLPGGDGSDGVGGGSFANPGGGDGGGGDGSGCGGGCGGS